MSRPTHRVSWIDTLKLPERDRRALLEELEHAAQSPTNSELRHDARLPYDIPAGVLLKLYHPGGSEANYLVRPRNLSSGGISFLHGSFLHKASRCGLLLRTVDDKARLIDGQVQWCRHLRGCVHEIGAAFDEPIRLSTFLNNMVGASREQHQSLELPKLYGRVLYVDDSVDAQELLRFQLSGLGVDMDTAADGLRALELAEAARFSLILIDVMLPGMTGAEVTRALRESGYTGPIVAVTADESNEGLDEARRSGCTDVLIRPYTLERLVELLIQHLPAAQTLAENEVVYSECWTDPAMRPLILGFLDRLEQQMRQLTQLVNSGYDAELFRKVCLDLKGSAGGYGYPQLSQIAEELYRLAGDGGPEGVARKLGELEQLCTAACSVKTMPKGGR